MGNFQRLGSRMARLSTVMVLSAGLLAACGGGSDPGSQSMAETGRKQALAVQAAASAELQVVELAKVSEVRVSRTVFDYTFQVRVRNTGRNAYKNVALTRRPKQSRHSCETKVVTPPLTTTTGGSKPSNGAGFQGLRSNCVTSHLMSMKRSKFVTAFLTL